MYLLRVPETASQVPAILAVPYVMGLQCNYIGNRTEIAMKAKIVRIGNSQGLRIPKPLLEQTGLVGEVEIEVKDRSLVISPLGEARSGWESAFAAMERRGDDALLDELPTASVWDEVEWEWE